MSRAYTAWVIATKPPKGALIQYVGPERFPSGRLNYQYFASEKKAFQFARRSDARNMIEIMELSTPDEHRPVEKTFG